MKETKLQKIIFILEELHNRETKTIDAYDDVLKEAFSNVEKAKSGSSPKQIGRLLDEMASELPNIYKTKEGKKNIYKLIKPMDLFVESFDHTKDISWVINMIHDSDPELFPVLEEHTKKSSRIYKFLNTPFEDTQTLEAKETFSHLKKAVEHREYRKITFTGGVQDNLKCLKLVYMENNWYIAYVDSKDKVLFGRISLIEKVEYASNIGSFQPSSVKEHFAFLETIQNTMTLYGKPKKLAKFKISSKKAKYFDEGMKLRLSSQKFVKKLDDGSIIFTVEYTQVDEVLPLVQAWLPHLVILEPEELKTEYLKRLKETLTYHK